MAKKTLKNNKKKDSCTQHPTETISFGEAFLDVRMALIKTVELATERYLGVIQKLQELESRMDKLELPSSVRNDPLPGVKPLPKLNGPSKQSETSDPMDSI